MILHMTVSVRRDALASFREFEHEAARIMQKYSGKLERVLVLKTPDSEPHREVHIISFPSEDAFGAYRASPELAAFQPLRETSVVRTELVRAEEFPVYGA